jgi:GT2 family glycosyltransferase
MPSGSISIGLVVHNEVSNILDLLNQLKLFVGKKVCEVVIVDNASTDSTAEVIRTWMTNNPLAPIKLITHEFNHMALARNKILHEAQGEWIYFIDADCRLKNSSEAEFIKTVESEMADKNAAAIGGGNLVSGESFWLDRRLSEMSRVWLGHMGSIQLRPPQERQSVALLSTCNMLVRKASALQCDGCDSRYAFVGEDMSLCHRLLEQGHQLVAIPGIEVIHLQRLSLWQWGRKMICYGEAQVHIALRYPAHFKGLRGLQFISVLMALALLLLNPFIFAVCFGAYLGLIGCMSFWELKSASRTFAAIWFISLSHALYAAGELLGTVTGLRFLYSTKVPKSIPTLEQQ